ncbi:MAG: hypothetical protein WDN28_15525 [Chthoniobacter sp.]
MDDYSPERLSFKWGDQLPTLLAETRKIWEQSRPRKTWFSRFGLERDARQDAGTPIAAQAVLQDEGRVVWAHVARAFFPAYMPGRHTHYGSVVYAWKITSPIPFLNWPTTRTNCASTIPLLRRARKR